MSFALLVAPASIAFHGAWSCLRRYRRARGGGPLSLQLDFKRRTVELALHGSFLLSIGLELWSSALLAGSGMQEYWRFSPLTGTFLFAIFAVLLYHSTTKLAKTHFRTDGRSEAVRLKGRLSTQRYMQWLAEPRQGIMLQVDLKNSSIAASSLKSRIHTLMQSLCDAMRASHQALGYHWILAKKNGDEWIVILSPKHAALKDDLEEVTLATLAEAPAWRRLVQSVAPESSVHVNVFALTTYTLSDGQASVEGSAAAEHETESNWDVLDFASREANYLMKWGGKSRHTGTVILGCNASLLTPALKGLTEDTQKLSRLIAAQDGAAPESVFDAESLGLILAYLPCSDEASVPDDTNGLAS